MKCERKAIKSIARDIRNVDESHAGAQKHEGAGASPEAQRRRFNFFALFLGPTLGGFFPA